MYAACISLQLATIFGMILGFNSYLLPQLENGNQNFTVTADDINCIGSSGVSLRVIGAVIDTFGADILGRKIILQISYLGSAIGWATIALSVNSEMLIISRMFTGIFGGNLRFLRQVE